jgi:hypothetical protein
MSKFRYLLSVLLVLVPGLSLAQAAPNPQVVTLPTLLEVCHGTTTVMSQAQDGTALSIDVEVALADCDGQCVGSLEYDLILSDTEGAELKWHLTETWEWRDASAPFTLQLRPQAVPGATLKEVQNLRLGRCSCSPAQASGRAY